MIDRLRALFRRSRDLNDLNAMSDHELADLGVSRAQAMDLARLPDDVPGRVAAMARLFGLTEDQLSADRDVWHALVQTCNHCEQLPKCARFMAAEASYAEDALFCPNRRAFNDLVSA